MTAPDPTPIPDEREARSLVSKPLANRDGYRNLPPQLSPAPDGPHWPFGFGAAAGVHLGKAPGAHIQGDGPLTGSLILADVLNGGGYSQELVDFVTRAPEPEPEPATSPTAIPRQGRKARPTVPVQIPATRQVQRPRPAVMTAARSEDPVTRAARRQVAALVDDGPVTVPKPSGLEEFAAEPVSWLRRVARWVSLRVFLPGAGGAA